MIDGVLILLMLVFAISGYRLGFVVGALSFGGFLSGVLTGLLAGPPIASQFTNGTVRLVVSLAAIFALAVLGHTLAGWLGTRIRRAVVNRPLQRLDHGGGAVVSLVTALLVAWLVAVPLASTPFPQVNKQVRSSLLLNGIDSLLPQQAQTLSAGLRDSLSANGFPSVLAGLATDNREVPAPDPGLVTNRVVLTSRNSVVKVTSEAQSCGRHIEGSGFVYADQRVMTNAHVVAGTRITHIQTPNGSLDGRVVVYDPKRDLAVIYVPGLAAPAMPFAKSLAGVGADAIVLGFPLDGPYNAQSARVRNAGPFEVKDIYDAERVTREIYTIRADVRSGNSGGPLVALNGDVLGVVFATSVDNRDTGFALTAAEVASTAKLGTERTYRADTGPCT